MLEFNIPTEAIPTPDKSVLLDGIPQTVVELNVSALKQYKDSAATSASNASTSATNAAASEANALAYKNAASTSATNAATSEANTLSYKNATSELVNGFDTKVATSKTEIESLATTKKSEITSLSTDKKTEITNLATEKKDAITTEGARVLGTIPADYTSTTKDVANLKALGLYIDSDGDISQL